MKLLQRWRVSSFIWTESADTCITRVNEGQESQSKSRLLHISSSSNIHTVSGRRGKVGADGYFLYMQLAHDDRGDMSLRGSDQQEVKATLHFLLRTEKQERDRRRMEEIKRIKITLHLLLVLIQFTGKNKYTYKSLSVWIIRIIPDCLCLLLKVKSFTDVLWHKSGTFRGLIFMRTLIL